MQAGTAQLSIDVPLVQRLVRSQFPQWADLPVQPVERSGWDNRTFHLGNEMVVRLPSAADYAAQVDKEQKWLPRLAPLLPLPIPHLLGIGAPTTEYPWKWSINRWLHGQAATQNSIADMRDFALDLANFLSSLQRIDTADGPITGPQSFYRGGSLSVYDCETRQAIAALKEKIDQQAALQLWEAALKTTWTRPLVWVHGDISLGNLLLHDGRLSAVIDFGQLAVGDPACDLAIAWTLFSEESRQTFRNAIALDDGTWLRGAAWALWKALIVAVGMSHTNALDYAYPLRVIEAVLASESA